MQDIKIFKQKDLVLKVNKSYDLTKLDLDLWDLFLDKLCGDREYQKEAIKIAIIYLASGRYAKIEDLIKEIYPNNLELQAKYSSLSDYKKHLQLPNKLFANIDLATGAGKSYVIYVYYILLITFAGTPYAMTLSGISLFTKLDAPMIEFSPMVIPGMITECVPMQDPFLSIIVPCLLSMVETEYREQ